MQKLTSLLLLILIALQPGCQKNNETAAVAERSAHVFYGGEPAADGTGYSIRLDSTGEIVIPINLPNSYRHPGVNEAVAVRLVDDGNHYYYGFRTAGAGTGYRGVYIVTLRKL